MDARTPEPDRPRSVLSQKSTTTGVPKEAIPTRAARHPYLRRASYDPSQLANVDIVQGGEQRRRSLSSLCSEDDFYTNPGSMSREPATAPAHGLSDSPEHQPLKSPDPFLSPTKIRLSSHPPTGRHGSSNTQLYHIPAGDARGLGIITETSESVASLAALSPRQAVVKSPPSANTQTQKLSKTRSAQDNATALLSSPYIPIAEAAKKRALDGLAPKRAELEAPNAGGRVASFANASSSFVSLPETEILCDGTLWYLYVRSGQPCRWVHCKAILTKRHLELSWNSRDGPSSVEFDLYRCRQLRAMPCASHPTARADIGSVAAYEEKNTSLNLVEDLYPFHVTYKEDIERLAADSVRERIRWVGFILDALTRLERNAGRTHTPPMTHPPRLRSLSTGSLSQGHVTSTRSPALSISLPRFRRSLRYHSRTKSGGDLPTPTEEGPKTKPAPLRRINSMLENSNPAYSPLDQLALPTSIPSSTRKRKISNPMSFVTSIFGKLTPSDGSSSRFFTRSRLLSRRELDTPSPLRDPEPALGAGSTDVKKRKKPPAIFDSLSRSTTATNITFTPSSFSYTSGGAQNRPSTFNTTTSAACLTSDSLALPSPERSSTAPNIDWRSEGITTGASSSSSVYATANVIASSSSPRITAHSQSMTPSILQTVTEYNTATEGPPRSRVTSASTIRTANALESSLHLRSSSNKDLPSLPVPSTQRKDETEEVKPEPVPFTLDDIIALESPKSWRSLSPQEEISSSVSQPVKTPAKKATITNQPRFPSTFRQLTLQEDSFGQQDSPLLDRSALPHAQALSVISSSTPGPARVTPQKQLGAPVLQDLSRCSTPTPASASAPASARPSSVRSARRISGSSLSSGNLKPTLPLRLSTRRSSSPLPMKPTTSGGSNIPSRSIIITPSRLHRESETETPDLTLPLDQESLVTTQDILMQLRRRDRERGEERHAFAEQLERIERELWHLSAFVRQHNGGVGLRSPGEQIVPVANLNRWVGSGPLGEDIVNWPTHQAGTGTDGVESMDSMTTVLGAAMGASEIGGSEELGDGGPVQEIWSRPTPPPSAPTPTFIFSSSTRRTDSFSTQANSPSPSFLGAPAGSSPILGQVTDTRFMGSLNDLRRTMDHFIRRQQITNDMLEDLRGRIPVHQMEGVGVIGLANYTEVLSRMFQSLRPVPDQLRTPSGDEPVEVSAPSQSPIALDVQTDVNVSKTTPQEISTPSSPLPEPPSVHLARIRPLTSPPSPPGTGYPLSHAPNEPLQQPSIWQPRPRRVVPRRRVFSEPSSSASQKTGSAGELRERERGQAPGDSGTSSIARYRPSILRPQSPDSSPQSGSQYETSNKPNVLTSVRPMYQRSVSAPAPNEGVSAKSKPKKRSVAWASPVVSDFNTFETSRARTDPDPQTILYDAPQVVSIPYPPSIDFQEIHRLIGEINLSQINASNQQSEVVRYLTELNDWLGRDSQDRQSEFRGIGSRIDILNTLVDGFIHQTPPFPAVHNAQGLVDAPPSQEAIQGDIIIPQIAISEVPRSTITTPCNVTGMTGVLPQSMSPATTILSRSVADSTWHNFTPSSIDILTDTARVPLGSPSSPSLPGQRESETPLADTTSPTFPTISLTDRDTIKSTPALAVPRKMGQPLSFDVPHATLASVSAHASSLGPMSDCNDVSELYSPPSDIGQQSTLPQESLSQPQPEGTIILAPSPLSTAGTTEVSNLARPTLHQTSIHSVNVFPGNRNAEQDTLNTSFSPQVTPIDFPEPSHFVSGSVQTPVQGTIPPSPDRHPYPHLITATNLRSRRALSLPASPVHGLAHQDTAGKPAPQSLYLNQADSFPIAPIEDPSRHFAWHYPPKSQEPREHESGMIPEPVTVKRPLPQPVSFQRNQGESWLAPQIVLRPDDSISMAGARQGPCNLQAPLRVHQDATSPPPSSIAMHPGPDLPFVSVQSDYRSLQPINPFVPLRNAPEPGAIHEKPRVGSAALPPFPNVIRGTNPLTAQQGINADARPDTPVASPTDGRVQEILASVHTSLAAQKQDREYYIQQVAQIAQRDEALLEEERKRNRELEETLQKLTTEAGEGRSGQMWDMQKTCEEARLTAQANHESLLSHIKEFTARIDASLQEGAAQRQAITGHFDLKEQKRVEKDNRWAALENTLRKVGEDEATERLRVQKQREEEALRPGTEQVIEELRGQNTEHQRLLTEFMNVSLARIQQQHEETLDMVRRTASEQVPFNIRKYLEEFSNALAVEVSTLLQETGQLREDRRSLQHEIGYLLCLKSKYAPDGEFNAGWQPPAADLGRTHTNIQPEAIRLSSVMQDQPATIPQHYPPASAPPPPPKPGTLRKKAKGHAKSRTTALTNDTQAPSLVPIATHHGGPFTVSNNITPAAPSSRTPRLYGPRAPETGVTSLRHAP